MSNFLWLSQPRLLQNVYTLYTVLFHNYGGADVSVTNYMSPFSIFVSTKATVKMANGNTGHAQGIGIILCLFTNCYILYPLGQVYYFLGHHSNTISSGALKFYVGFQKFTFEPIKHCEFVDSIGSSLKSLYQNQNNIDYFQIDIVKVSPQIDRNIVVPTVCLLSKQNTSQIIHQHFGHVYIDRLKLMSRK